VKNLLIALALAGALLGQSFTPLSTTTASSITANVTVIPLASTAGIVAGQYLYIDREAMQITATGATAATVTRGALQTRIAPHASAVTVYAAPAATFVTVDQAGSCSAPAAAFLINAQSGNQSTCTAGSWAVTVYGAAAGGGGSAAQMFLANYNGSTLAATGGLSAAIPVLSLAAGSSLRGQRISTVTRFAATGLSALACSLGDSSDHARYSGGATIDVSLAVTATSAIWDGGFVNTTLAANTVNLYCTATGANLNTLTAGQIKIVLDVVAEPSSSTVVQ
jgi:hypothetical protein